MLGNSRGARPLALLAVLDRAAKLPRCSRSSRLARALRERSRLASARTRSSVASEASGLECLVGVTAGGLGETLEIGKGEFGDGWDTVKILHRGLGVFAETVTQDAERRKLIIRFR